MPRVNHNYTRDETRKIIKSVTEEIKGIFLKYGRLSRKRIQACRLIIRAILRTNLPNLSINFMKSTQDTNSTDYNQHTDFDNEILDNMMYIYPQEWTEIVNRYCTKWQHLEGLFRQD